MKTNTELQQDILQELHSDPQLKASATEIGVFVHDGTVTLCGQVNSYEKKMAAENAAKRVKGVKVIAIKIDVVLPGTHASTDTEIARMVHQAIKWHLAMEEEEIQVKVEDGWIYLEGRVNQQYQKILAEQAIENIAYIKGIINMIEINQTKKQCPVPVTEEDTFSLPTIFLNDCTPFTIEKKKVEPTPLPKERDEKEVEKIGNTGVRNVHGFATEASNFNKRFGYRGLKSSSKGGGASTKTSSGKSQPSITGGNIPCRRSPSLPPYKSRRQVNL